MKIIGGIILFIMLYILWKAQKAVIGEMIKTTLYLPTESNAEKENEDMSTALFTQMPQIKSNANACTATR